MRKVVRNAGLQPGEWTLVTDTRFLYDGWNVIAEFEMNQQSQIANLTSTYAWGLDLSGTMTGAGGVGGLLFVKLYSTPSSPLLAPCFDGNGNVLAYLNCASGTVQARYEYDPFGRVMQKEETAGVAAKLHHQFSTKYTDAETGLSYYGFRHYSPEMGRWLSRDPIGEDGGINVYVTNVNDLISQIDLLGACACSVQSFKMSASGWIEETSGWFSKSVKLLLRVKFDLIVADKEACIIRQDKKGEVPGNGAFTSSNWTADGGDWWNGESWTAGLAGRGLGEPRDSGWRPNGINDQAIFWDEPGFNNVAISSFPRWMAGYGQSGNGFYRFKTKVLNRDGNEVVKSLEWGLRIYCPKGAKSHGECIHTFTF